MSAQRFVTFRLPQLIAVTIALMMVSPTTIHSSATPAVSSSACVRLFQQTDQGVNLQITTLDTRNGHSTTTTQPTIPPLPWLSPDGKYATFWQMTPDQQAGLYLASTTNSNPTLIYETTPDDAMALLGFQEPIPFAWSPDSSQFAFAGHKSNQYFLTVTNPDGKTTKTLQISPSKDQSKVGDVVFFGWSADSKYFAAEVESTKYGLYGEGELRVWSANDENQVASGLIMAPGGDGYYTASEWSPQGHLLSTLLKSNQPARYADQAAQITIWSPERGIQSTDTVYISNYSRIFWSPNGQQLIFETGADGPSTDVVYGVADGLLRKAKPDQTFRYFAGWSADERAIVTDLLGDFENPNYQLALIDANKGAYDIVVPDLVSQAQVFVLPGGKRMVYLSLDKADVNGTVKYKTILSDVNGQHALTIFDEPYDNTSAPDPFWQQHESHFDWDRAGNAISSWWSIAGKKISTYVHPDGSGLVNDDILLWIDNHRYVRAGERSNSLELVDQNTGTVQSLGSMPSDQTDGFNDRVISPDARSIVMFTNAVLQRIASNSFMIASIGDSHSSVRQISSPLLDLSYLFFGNGLHIPESIDWEPYSLSWSPDSSMLAFVLDDKATDSEWNGPQRDLVVISRDGTERQRVKIPTIAQGLPVAALTWVPCES